MRCIWPLCRRRGTLVSLPLTAERVSLCDLHRGPRFLGHVKGLTAHG